ncbi:MAG TPA: site-specific integrase [Roseiarcus sp.]
MRHAEWSEFDLDARVWAIPAGKMKMRRDHFSPVAPQTVALLRQLRALGLRGQYLFPGRTVTRCMSENTITAALRRMGFASEEMSGHGFRASASTLLNASGHWNADAIEAQLAHVDNDKVRRAYNPRRLLG